MAIELAATQGEEDVAGAQRPRIGADASHQRVGAARELLARTRFGDVLQTSWVHARNHDQKTRRDNLRGCKISSAGKSSETSSTPRRCSSSCSSWRDDGESVESFLPRKADASSWNTTAGF